MDTTPLFTGFNDLDQISKIQFYLGEPQPERDASFYSQLPQNHFFIKKNSDKSAFSFEEHFSRAKPDMLNLLKQMLSYGQRPSAETCLKLITEL